MSETKIEDLSKEEIIHLIAASGTKMSLLQLQSKNASASKLIATAFCVAFLIMAIASRLTEPGNWYMVHVVSFGVAGFSRAFCNKLKNSYEHQVAMLREFISLLEKCRDQKA